MRIPTIIIATTAVAGFAAVSGCEQPVQTQNMVFQNERLALAPAQLSNLTRRGKAGDAAASYRVAEYYEYVMGDYATADMWLLKSAQQGSPKAQYAYGSHLFGQPDEKSKRQGAMWIKKAAANGLQLAIDAIKRDKIE